METPVDLKDIRPLLEVFGPCHMDLSGQAVVLNWEGGAKTLMWISVAIEEVMGALDAEAQKKMNESTKNKVLA